MKEYRRILVKGFTLVFLLLSLVWVGQRSTSAAKSETCEECQDNYTACVQYCSTGNDPTCLHSCYVAFQHCNIFCE